MKQPVLKQAFQAVSFMLAQVATTDPYAAARSAGVMYDNLASGVTAQKVKDLFKPKG